MRGRMFQRGRREAQRRNSIDMLGPDMECLTTGDEQLDVRTIP